MATADTIHRGDYQTLSFLGTSWKVNVAAGGVTLPPVTLDDETETTTGDMGSANGQHRGMRYTVGAMTAAIRYDLSAYAIPIGGASDSTAVGSLVWVVTKSDGTTVTRTIPSMALKSITPDQVAKEAGVITLEFNRHDIDGTSEIMS